MKKDGTKDRGTLRVSHATFARVKNLSNRIFNETGDEPTHDQLVAALLDAYEKLPPPPPPATSEEEQLAREFIRWTKGPHDPIGEHLLEMAMIQMKRYQ